MEQQLFFKTIRKNLNCSKVRKKEILQEIKADIAAAEQSGESWPQIERKMGNPGEMAADFNENMSEKEWQQARREKKRRTILWAVGIPVSLILVFIGVMWWLQPKVKEFGTSGRYTAEKMAQQVSTVLTLINEDRGEELLRDYSISELGSMITPEQIIATKQLINPDWGGYQRITSRSYMELYYHGKVLAVAQIMALYDNCSVMFRFTFNEDMLLEGFYLYK